MSIINARITKPGQPPKHPSYHSAPEDIKAAAKNLAKNIKEETDLDQETQYEIVESYLLENNIDVNSLTEEELIFYENIFKKYYDKNDVLISDNIIFKNYIKLKYNIKSYDTKICHLGNANYLEEVKDTLFDFFLISKSKNVKTFTNYAWISGFIQWNSNIYNIPITQMK
jgi:hypothetical protein